MSDGPILVAFSAQALDALCTILNRAPLGIARPIMREIEAAIAIHNQMAAQAAEAKTE